MTVEELQKKFNKRIKIQHKRRQLRGALNLFFTPDCSQKAHRHYDDKPLITRTRRHPRSTKMFGQK